MIQVFRDLPSGKPLWGESVNVNQAKRAVRLREWSQMIQDRQDSGMTVRTWCERNGIKEAKYYYGLSQVRKAVLAGFNPELPEAKEQPKLVRVDMARLPAAEGSSRQPTDAITARPSPELPTRTIRLEYGGGTLEIPEGASAEAIAEVLKALSLNAV